MEERLKHFSNSDDVGSIFTVNRYYTKTIRNALPCTGGTYNTSTYPELQQQLQDYYGYYLGAVQMSLPSGAQWNNIAIDPVDMTYYSFASATFVNSNNTTFTFKRYNSDGAPLPNLVVSNCKTNFSGTRIAFMSAPDNGVFYAYNGNIFLSIKGANENGYAGVMNWSFTHNENGAYYGQGQAAIGTGTSYSITKHRVGFSKYGVIAEIYYGSNFIVRTVMIKDKHWFNIWNTTSGTNPWNAVFINPYGEELYYATYNINQNNFQINYYTYGTSDDILQNGVNYSSYNNNAMDCTTPYTIYENANGVRYAYIFLNSGQYVQVRLGPSTPAILSYGGTINSLTGLAVISGEKAICWNTEPSNSKYLVSMSLFKTFTASSAIYYTGAMQFAFRRQDIGFIISKIGSLYWYKFPLSAEKFVVPTITSVDMNYYIRTKGIS